MPVRLRIGVHIEQETTLTLVQTMLDVAGHRTFLDSRGEHSLAAYLGSILDQARTGVVLPYDLLIVGGEEADSLVSGAVLKTLAPLLALFRLPILILTATPSRSGDVWQDVPHVAVLSSYPLLMRQFFQTLGRLTQTATALPTPRWGSVSTDKEDWQASLRAEERRRVQVRFTWLDQRQEWLDLRNTWLQSRQAWLEAKEKEADSQQEWLAEQTAWLEQQRRDVEDQQRIVNDLRRWLARYQRRIDEEEPPSLQGDAVGE